MHYFLGHKIDPLTQKCVYCNANEKPIRYFMVACWSNTKQRCQQLENKDAQNIITSMWFSYQVHNNYDNSFYKE